MRRFLAALLCILLCQGQLAAQSFTTSERSKTLTPTGVFGDGSNTRGGNPSAYLIMPAEIASPSGSYTTWVTTGSGVSGEYTALTSTANEAKFRNDCSMVFSSQNDPIVASGSVNGGPHLHATVGNDGVNSDTLFANATTAWLRSNGTSTCWGGVMNRSLYWEPALLRSDSAGNVFHHKATDVSFYYSCGVGQNQANECTMWPRGFNAIFGKNPSDMTNSRVATMIAAANAAVGSSRFRAASLEEQNAGGNVALSGWGSSNFNGWSCETPVGDGKTAYAVTSPSGEQPYLIDQNGHITIDCVFPGRIRAGTWTPPCWDGENLSSPDGRKHLMPFVYDTTTGRYRCPDGWYRVIQLEVASYFWVTSNTELQNMYLSSDRMNAPGTAADPSSSSPCRQVSAYFCPGETFHADFMFAWETGHGDAPGVFLKAFINCMGGTVRWPNASGGGYTTLTGSGHTCGNGRFSATEELVRSSQEQNDGRIGADRYFPFSRGTSLKGHIHTG